MLKILSLFLACWIVSFGMDASATFVPESEIRPSLLTNTSKPANVSEAEFRQIISRVQQSYSSVVSKHGATLSISGDWANNTPNAGATQIFKSWQVKITGGLARRPELSGDGLTLIVCHELGHHLAGFAFVPADFPLLGVWAAAEGQADYFATHVCARKIWAEDRARNAEFRSTIEAEMRQLCDAAWTLENEQNLCYRQLVAVDSMTKTMAAIMGKPAPLFSTPDPEVVSATKTGHPAIQCRMDTSYLGAICSSPFSEAIIPGKTVGGDPFGIEAEREAAANSCTTYSQHTIGLRPPCWFKARL